MTNPRLIVTTPVKASAAQIAEAHAWAQRLGAVYWARRNQSVAFIFRESGAERCLIVGEPPVLRDALTETAYFYHPNLAFVRAQNLFRGQRDLFADATALEPGQSLLDCTLGFAGEATLAALLVGESGRVVGLESVPELAELTRHGLPRFDSGPPAMAVAMKRVEVVTADYRAYLPEQETAAYDVVYFDPFFGERLHGSENSVTPLTVFGNLAPLDVRSVYEARRVAARRVVVKCPWDHPLPEELAALNPEKVGARKSRLVYYVFEAGADL